MSSLPLPRSVPKSAIASFRGEVRASADLHPLEMALTVTVGFLLCFMPWALGTMHVWSQITTLVLTTVALVVSLISRNYRGDLAPQGNFKLVMWPKLIRFPLFWIGLFLLLYITTQALNPSMAYTTDGKVWWLAPVKHIGWLPAGVEAPFEKMNAWRVLIIYTSAWFLVCALWTGITRRSAIQSILTVVVSNGALISIIGILQKVTQTTNILWVIPPRTGYEFATLLYKNHAAAYLNIVLMTCTALLYWHFSRSERRQERTSPAPIFAFFCILLGVSVVLTNSRAGTMLMMGFTLIAFVGFVIRAAMTRGEGRSGLSIAILCGTFALFIGLGSFFIMRSGTVAGINRLLSEGRGDDSVITRTLARQATMDMAKDDIITGWGAGSFRHAFPIYQNNYPRICYAPWAPDRKMRWEYAHNDYVQLLAELGLVGAGIMAAIAFCGVRFLLINHVYRRPHLMFIVLALLITVAHCWIDFQFHNPAILLLWCASAVLLGRWAELEDRRR